MVSISKFILCAGICILVLSEAKSQQGLLQQIQLSDYDRRQQLVGDSTIRQSFTIFPINRESTSYFDQVKKDGYRFRSTFGYTLQYNSGLPYGYNDESLIPAIGLQQRITAGFDFETKYFQIKFQPEWIMAANESREGLIPPADNTLNNYWGRYFAMLANRIDMPSQFGTAPFKKVFPGQSAIRFKTGKLSMGISTENIWWGPARFNALIMGNNAPGFFHATVNTTSPLATPIGNIEAQVILGLLTPSRVRPLEADRIAQLGCPQCYERAPDTARSIAGFVFSYSPKGLPNFSMGMAYAAYRYAQASVKASSLGSLFFKYAMPKDHAEIYAEYGRSDKMMSPFDLFKDSVPYGYTIGLRKMIPTRKKNQFISISFELSHLGLSNAGLIFDRNNVFGPPNPNAYTWYTSNRILQGYTNFGQTMGASIGPGSNSQTLNISWHDKENTIGFQVQRVKRNTDFYYYNYYNGTIGGGSTAAFWVDITPSLFAQWRYKQFLFAGSLDYVSSINYKWLKLDGDFGSTSSLSDKKNLQIRASLLYRINWYPK